MRALPRATALYTNRYYQKRLVLVPLHEVAPRPISFDSNDLYPKAVVVVPSPSLNHRAGAGLGHTCNIAQDNTLHCWGKNGYYFPAIKRYELSQSAVLGGG